MTLPWLSQTQGPGDKYDQPSSFVHEAELFYLIIFLLHRAMDNIPNFNK